MPRLINVVHVRETPKHTAIALHYGKVSYGNVETGRALEFTAIGRDGNLLRRIQTACCVLRRSILMSEPFR